MAVNLVQGRVASLDSGSATTTRSWSVGNVVIGNGALVFVFCNPARTINSVTGGGTYELIGSGTSANDLKCGVYYCRNLTSAAASVVVTLDAIDGGAGPSELVMLEVSGQNTTANPAAGAVVAGGITSASSATDAIATATFTPSATTDLSFAFAIQTSGGGATSVEAGTGWTSLGGNLGLTQDRLQARYAPSTSAQSATFTAPGTSGWSGYVAAASIPEPVVSTFKPRGMLLGVG